MAVSKSNLKESIRRVITSVRHLGMSQDQDGKLSIAGEQSKISLKLTSLAASAVNLELFTEKEINDFFDQIDEGDGGRGVDIQLLRMSVAIQAVLTWIREQGLPDVEPREIVHECLGLPPEHPEIIKEIKRIQQRALKAMGPAAPRPRPSS
jgi:hypothetical protein